VRTLPQGRQADLLLKGKDPAARQVQPQPVQVRQEVVPGRQPAVVQAGHQVVVQPEAKPNPNPSEPMSLVWKEAVGEYNSCSMVNQYVCEEGHALLR